VLLNLLSNAIKFTPEGGRIQVRAKPVNGSAEVLVTDTGVDQLTAEATEPEANGDMPVRRHVHAVSDAD
jgi:Histidine kinase-, DNA gyrase B-, and HSP90-like ATPase